MTAEIEPLMRKRTPRPRNRKQQIVTAAGELFYQRGFHNVGTTQIAEAVGITPGALYRHFRSKQELLSHTITDAFDQAIATVADETSNDLTEMVAGLSATASERRYLGILWNRDARFLSPDALAAMRARFFAALDEIARRLMLTRPELSHAEAELLAWCTLGVLTSPSYHRAELAPAQVRPLLEAMAMVVCTTAFAADDPASPNEHAVGLKPHGRREAIVAAATRLFNESGYQSTSMDDVGNAVRISGAAVYKYFPSKVDLLRAVIARASEPLHLGLTRALAQSSDPSEGLSNVLSEYVDFASEHHDLVGILVSEVPYLPEEDRRAVRRSQHEYVAEWIRLLRASRPELDERRARFLVHGVLTVVNDTTRTPHLLSRPNLAAELRGIGARILAV